MLDQPVDALSYDSKEKLCPVCGFEYVHIHDITFIPDGDDGGGIPVVISSERGSGKTDIRVGPERVKSMGRGCQVALSFFCEEGHRWAEVSAFHKGQTYLRTVRLSDLPLGGV